MIYHTKGVEKATPFITDLINRKDFHISVITKIEFLGWNEHTQEGFDKCKRLIELCNIIYIDDLIAEKAIEIRRESRTRLADALIAGTALKYD